MENVKREKGKKGRTVSDDGMIKVKDM